MRNCRFIYYILLCLCISCYDDSGFNEDNNKAKFEPADHTPYEDTSNFVKYYSGDSVSSIQIGPNIFEITTFMVFSKHKELRPYYCYPSVAITSKGTILHTCSNLQILADVGEMDVLLARKEKDTETWEIKRIFQTDSVKGRAMCPALVVDKTTGRIYVFNNYFKKINKFGDDQTYNDAEHVFKYSDDDGMTWSCEYSLKQNWDSFCHSFDFISLFNNIQLKNSYESGSLWYKKDNNREIGYINKENIICITSGPGGISMDNGTLLIPSYVLLNGISYSSLLIRENGCWRFSRPTPNSGDCECTVYLDNYNRIVLDCRTEYTTRTKYYYNIDMDVYTEAESSKIGSFVRVSTEIVNDDGLFYMCYPSSLKNERKDLTFYGSKDGINWKKIFLIKTSEPSSYGYSSIALYNKKLLISYESPEGIIIHDLSPCRDAIRNSILNN